MSVSAISRRFHVDGVTGLWGGFSRMTIAREEVTAGSVFPWRKLPELVLLLTQSGRAFTRCRETKVFHEPGSLVVVGPDTEFEEYAVGDQAWVCTYFILGGPMADALGWKGKLGKYHPVPNRFRRNLEVVAEGIWEVSSPESSQNWRSFSSLIEVLAWLAQEAAEHKNLTFSERVDAAVDGNPSRLWTLEELAGLFPLPALVFSRRFAAEVGCSPVRWVRQRRIRHAQRWLALGHSVAETSDRLGFADPFHFSKVFFSVTGKRPSAVRSSSQHSRFRGETSKGKSGFSL